MKGIVFNLLAQAVEEEFGEDTWDTLLDKAGVEGAFTSVGSYADDDLYALVRVASQALGREQDDVLRWLGSRAIPMLVSRYPQFFADHTRTLPFLLTLNDVIHPEVRKLFPGADAPEFEFDQRGADTLALAYVSNRGLCSFAEGLVDGAAAHFGESVTITQSECMKKGDARCVLICTFSPAAVARPA